jgi:hypothetical protein
MIVKNYCPAIMAEKSLSTILIIVLLGGGGFGYSRHRYGGAGGILGLVLAIFLVLWLLGAVEHA